MVLVVVFGEGENDGADGNVDDIRHGYYDEEEGGINRRNVTAMTT